MPVFRDPIPYDALSDRVSRGKTIASAQAALHQAWREYADRATKPYAWGSFAKMARRRLTRDGVWPRRSPPLKAALANPPIENNVTESVARQEANPPDHPLEISPWASASPPVPRVLVLGSFAAMRIRGGALEIDHGSRKERHSLRFDVDAAKPAALLFDSHGEYMSGEALRWCARHGIALILPNGPDGFLSLLDTRSDTPGGTAIDPATVLAQCRSALDPSASVVIARDIVRAKIEAMASAAHMRDLDREGVRVWARRLASAKNHNELLIVEAHATAAYWRLIGHIGLRERKGGDLPRSWKAFPPRSRGRPSNSEGIGVGRNKASHPINAMLNYAYVVHAARLVRSLAARGFILPLGFLHVPKGGRNSLVWDAMEFIRAEIDNRILTFIKDNEFARGDFIEAGLNHYRLSRDVTQILLHNVYLETDNIESAAIALTDIIMRDADH